MPPRKLNHRRNSSAAEPALGRDGKPPPAGPGESELFDWPEYVPGRLVTVKDGQDSVRRSRTVAVCELQL